LSGASSSRPLALVTGASSGIGRAFAQRLAGDGYDLIVVGRRRNRLDELAQSLPDTRVQVVVADLASDAGIDQVASLCAEEPISLLVNNAGLAHYMPFAELTAAQAREVITVKVLAPTLLSRAVVAG
jgi:short-subunit dehydrogenase